MQTYARQAKDSELIDLATEIRLRAGRRAGELLREMAEWGERRGRHNETSSAKEPVLADLGVTKKQSHNWQKLAALDDDVFEKRVADAKRTPSVSSFMRWLTISPISCARWRTPEPIKVWSLTSLREKLIKIGAKVVSHGRYVAFQMAEVAIAKNLFADILRLIAQLRPPPDAAPA
jgi:DDE family transposase